MVLAREAVQQLTVKQESLAVRSLLYASSVAAYEASESECVNAMNEQLQKHFHGIYREPLEIAKQQREQSEDAAEVAQMWHAQLEMEEPEARRDGRCYQCQTWTEAKALVYCQWCWTGPRCLWNHCAHEHHKRCHKSPHQLKADLESWERLLQRRDERARRRR